MSLNDGGFSSTCFSRSRSSTHSAMSISTSSAKSGAVAFALVAVGRRGRRALALLFGLFLWLLLLIGLGLGLLLIFSRLLLVALAGLLLLAGLPDPSDHLPERDRLPLGHDDLDQRPVRVGLVRHVGLVGLDLAERLAALHLAALLDDPLEDRALLHGVGEPRHRDVGGPVDRKLQVSECGERGAHDV